MSRPDLMALAEEERTDLLDLLRGLDDEQWKAQSLCTLWSIRDVSAHVVSYDELSKATLAATFLRGGLRVSRVNEVALNRYDALEPDGVIDLLEGNLRPSGLAAGFGGAIALTDGTIHHQDIRRALDLPRKIPEHRLREVLGFALGAPTLPARKHAKGLKLVATDLDWCAGAGPEVTGPGEALLMSVTGRPSALDELNGPGLATMRSRLD